jgi:hypothetical protein
VVIPETSCPTSWFRDPLDAAIKNAVKPATMLTRRKEISIKMQLPRSVFEDFLSPLTEGDAEGLKRDEATGLLIPTKVTAAVRTYKYLIKRGSVSDRLFHLQTFDPSPRAPSTRTATGVQIVQAGEEDVWEVEAIIEARKTKRAEWLVKWEGWSEAYNSWEPRAHINPALIAEFEGKPPPPPPAAPKEQRVSLPKRGAGCARANLTLAAAQRGEIPQSISMVCGNVSVELQESVTQAYMPKATLTFQVLTMDKTGHIVWPTTFEAPTRAALRMQARALLRKLIDDPLSPVDETMAPALSGRGSDSVFKPAPKRKFMVVEN